MYNLGWTKNANIVTSQIFYYALKRKYCPHIKIPFYGILSCRNSNCLMLIAVCRYSYTSSHTQDQLNDSSNYESS